MKEQKAVFCQKRAYYLTEIGMSKIDEIINKKFDGHMLSFKLSESVVITERMTLDKQKLVSQDKKKISSKCANTIRIVEDFCCSPIFDMLVDDKKFADVCCDEFYFLQFNSVCYGVLDTANEMEGCEENYDIELSNKIRKCLSFEDISVLMDVLNFLVKIFKNQVIVSKDFLLRETVKLKFGRDLISKITDIMNQSAKNKVSFMSNNEYKELSFKLKSSADELQSFRKKEYEKNGGSFPPQILLKSLERILNYLDIIHHYGYSSFRVNGGHHDEVIFIPKAIL